MRERVELNRKLAPAAVPATVLNELCRHALDAVPEECCGMITGTAQDPFSNVRRMANVMTRMHVSDVAAFPRDGRTGYYMAEAEYLKAQKEAEARDERVTALYHSHVDADAYLSAEDLTYAESPIFPFPGALQIVLSVVGDRVKDAVLFDMDPELGQFTPGCGRLLRAREA